MKGISAQWYVCKVRLDRTQENGTVKKVTEAYAVDAVDFTEAEARTIEEVAQYATGEFEVKHISPAPFKEVVMDDKCLWEMHYYKVKLGIVTLDEQSAREKVTNVLYLVQAPSAYDAIEIIDRYLCDSMFEYHIAAVSETSIVGLITNNEKSRQ